MKRFLIFLIPLLICASANSGPLQKKHMVVIMSSATTTCTEDFTAADGGDVATPTDFESETDANSKLSILSNKMRFVNDGEVLGYVVETTCLADTDIDVTIKISVTFDSVRNGMIDNYGFGTFVQLYDDANTQYNAAAQFNSDAAGKINGYRSVVYDNGGTGRVSSTTTYIPPDATQFDCVFYALKGADGYASLSCGGQAAATTSTYDNSTRNGFGTARVGWDIASYGSVTTNIDFDNFEGHSYDAR